MSSPAPSVVDGITLRAARSTDVAEIDAIERSAFSDPWPESAFTAFLERAHVRMTVATGEQERVVGYCVLLTMADEAEIANIAVSPSHHRHGIAGRLLDQAIATARANGASAIYLEVRASNKPARQLYASRYFKLIGRRRNYYQNPLEDALILRFDVLG
jgi:[ribosomal protein S18]-alanine N-acetyltransferase